MSSPRSAPPRGTSATTTLAEATIRRAGCWCRPDLLRTHPSRLVGHRQRGFVIADHRRSTGSRGVAELGSASWSRPLGRAAAIIVAMTPLRLR
jgi:hypothetical protein